jgi:hypothetical protein
MTTVKVTNLIATTVSETAPTTNQNSSTRLGVRDYTNRDANAYINWSIPFPLTSTVSNAKLVFYTAPIAESGTHGFIITRLNQAFNATTVTYNTRPTSMVAGDLTVTKSGAQADKTKWEIDITAWMQAVSNGTKWYGIRLVPSVFEDIARWIYSELWTDTTIRPYVEMTWSDAPKKPTGLNPSGGLAVASAKPILKAQFVDLSGSTTIGFVQGQLSTT